MSTQEKLEQILDGIDKTEIEYENGWWETSTGAEFGAKKKQELQALIDSAKREGKKEALEKLVSLLHIYMDDKTPPGGEWPKQDMVVVVSFIESLVAQLEQSEESKLSACCGAEITETGFCTDCKDNC